ncbi:NAD-dependent epimerase/dehydratase family protein [Gynurincola endophyticus]|jgi:UDP-glucose 4-epimerase|uniref:NAD-dependent epimerase/dehydratase family protein n=1 Tax=Gynurincola endophyticus TaxID=2479004 RepID=UPI000F8EEE6C|nr:GDP-mannose 4,6-dehydratase [Gynurincola endophyticus]
MNKILITGGAGFIGSSIYKKFQSNNDEIFVIDNLSFGNRAFIDIDDDHFFEVDIRDFNTLDKTLKQIQPDYIIHLAAIHFIPYCNKHPFEASEINIAGTVNLLKSVRSLNSVKRLFFASTAAVYPILDNPIAETSTLKPLDIYGHTKLMGEHLFYDNHLITKIPTVVCRFFNAFGPNETNPHLIPEIADQINAGQRTIQLGNLTPKRDFIHTYDMAEAVFGLMHKFDKGYDVFNLGRGEEYSVTEIVDYFSAALGEKVSIEVDEARVRKVERMHLLADITKLKSFINWEPVIKPEEGIKTLLK